ncbi:MAG: YlxR family protein [Actinomycetes bacterium]
MRAAPRRTCVGCREKREKDHLLRLTRTPHGVRFDPEQRFEGRGAYVCPHPECAALAAARDGWAVRRALRGAPAAEVRAALEQLTTAIGGAPSPEPDSTVRSENA